MSEEADSSARTCEDSLSTLNIGEDKGDAPSPTSTAKATAATASPITAATTKTSNAATSEATSSQSTAPAQNTTSTYTGRRPRFGTGNAPASPYIWVDGVRLRSALAYTKKWPPRRVSFPTNDMHLVTGYLEPANPWRHAENVNREDLIAAYKESCERHNTEPVEKVLEQLENMDLSEERNNEFSLKGVSLDQNQSETIEEILKRVQFHKVDLEGTSLNDESSVILFDMLEYYESAKHLNISSNPDIGARGWQACSHMIKKTQCLEQFEAKDIKLNEQYMNILSRALRLVYHLHVLKLENCGLSGRPIVILVTALKMNTGIRELYLADNGLDLYDAIQLGSLLRLNNHLQLLDISNNNIQDDGVRDILEGLINQVNEDKDGKGLSILILWNNRLTEKSSPYFSRIISLSRTLETLNIGQNMLTSEMLIAVKDALKKNRILLQLGMQSTDLTCEGIIALADVIENNQVLQRIDLRDNSIQMMGMKALNAAMQKNKSVTQLDLDDKPRVKIDAPLHQYMDIVGEIRSYCRRNEQTRLMEQSNEGSESPKHHSRFCSASSRKISLTCQTLPCTPPPMSSITTEETGRSTLEPKRTSGGRLRSPAPSPIPSPVASPIPSPSRSRFVVSRVSEASLRSSDSSASSSPVTPPSQGPASTCFFPSTSGTSRFRVSLVESASCTPTPKSVVASSKSNVTIGFNFKIDSVDSTDSDDSDNVFKSEVQTDHERKVDTAQITKTSCEYSSSISIKVTDQDSTQSPNTSSIDTNEQSTNVANFVVSRDTTNENNTRNSVIACEKEHKEEYKDDNQNRLFTESRNNETTKIDFKGTDDHNSENANRLQTNERTNDTKNTNNIETIDSTKLNKNNELNVQQAATVLQTEKVELETQSNRNTPVQKHTSSLEKLLSLFQHRGSFFSDSSTTTISQTDIKNSLQGSVNSMMAFGDKFQQYLREGKGVCKSNATGLFADVPAKSKATKSLNVTQLPSIQTLTNMFASFKLESNTNTPEQPQTNNSCSKQMKHVNKVCNKEETKESDVLVNRKSQGSVTSSSYESRSFNSSSEEITSALSSNVVEALPEDVQSKVDGRASKDLVVDANCVTSHTVVEACSINVNSASSTNVPESKTTVPISKLKDIPEYSVLEVGKPDCEKERTKCCEPLMRVDSTKKVVKKKKEGGERGGGGAGVKEEEGKEVCDRSTTDSINLTSDEVSSSRNVTCDIRVIDNVNIINKVDVDARDAVNSHVNSARDVAGSLLFNVTNESDEATLCVYAENNNRSVNDVSMLDYSVSNINSVKKNEVTKTRNANVDNENKPSSLDSHNASSHETETANICHVDLCPHTNSTTVNSKINLSVSELSVIPKNNVDNFNCNNNVRSDRSVDLCGDKCVTTSPKKVEGFGDFVVEDDELLSVSKSVDICTTIYQNVATESLYLKNDVEDVSVKESDFDVPASILLTQETVTISTQPATESLGDYEKSDSDDLIFYITDISTDTNFAKEEEEEEEDDVEEEEEEEEGDEEEEEEEESFPGAWKKDVSEIEHSFFNLPQTPHHSVTTLLIEKPENFHRNSQDSGIEEANLSTLDDNIPEVVHSQQKERFQESVDSGIESEYSSVCVKANSSTNASKIETLKRPVDDVNDQDGACGRINDLTEFQQNIIEHVQPKSNDNVNDNNISHSCFKAMACTMLASTCTTDGMDIKSNPTVGVVSEENNRIVGKTSTVAHVASPK